MTDIPVATQRFHIYFEALPRYQHDDPLVAGANRGPGWMVEFVPMREPGGPRRFALWNPMDLLWPGFFTLQAHEDQASGTLLSGLPERVKMLMPDLPEDMLHSLTVNQIMAIGAKSLRLPGESEAPAAEVNPPNGERDSAMFSRSPLDSSAGAIAS